MAHISLKMPFIFQETEKNGNGEAEKNGTNGTTQAEENTKSETEQILESDSYNFFASSKRSKKGLSMEQDAMRRLGMQLTAPDFTNEDMKLPPWTDISRKLYRVSIKMLISRLIYKINYFGFGSYDYSS